MRDKKNLNFKKIISMVMIIISCFFLTAKAEPSQLDIVTKNSSEQIIDGIKYNKTATPTGVEGEYEIELKVSGNEKILPTDIILVMDKSYSMLNDISILKDSMRNFTEDILNKKNGIPDARISIIEFSGLDKPNKDGKWGSTEDAQLLYDFSDNIEDLNNAIANVKAEGSTNAEAAWLLTEKQLNKTRKNASKYVLFFTDGLPNRTVDGKSSSPQRGVEQAISVYNSIIKQYPDINTYSIGLIKNIHYPEDKRGAKSFLQKIQNRGSYFIENNASDLVDIYNEIANNIKLDKRLAKNVTISDEVTKEFEIVKDSSEVFVPLEDGTLEKINILPTVNGNKISWYLGDLGVEGRVIRFKIKLKDKYYGIGDDKINTNVEATMNYTTTDSGENKVIVFPKPEVSVPYKKGKITIEKEVISTDGLVIPQDDNFNISLNGVNNIGDYSVNIKKGESTELNFYLKYENSNVSQGNLEKKEFLNIGEYNIKEIIPMNYELEGIYVNGKKVTDEKFIIDNANSDIKIKIVNNYVNNKYFYDKGEERNILELKK
ncbi:VWA domain-containing protein [Clostridium perfringens]|nr:VWA domain-containing protein [Clostridium perfringens]